jgi:putative DNA primase/helicase
MNDATADNIIKLARQQRAAPQFSDDALALIFADRHAETLKYIAVRAQWMQWAQWYWTEDDTLHAFDLARIICREQAAIYKGKGKRAITSAKTVAAVERMAKADRRIAATATQWDAKPDILNSDRTIDLLTGADHAPQRSDYCTKTAAVAAAPPGTPCPLWMSFINKVTNNNDALIGFLQRFLGYCLTGRVHEHVLVFLYGKGANGKSVFVSTVARILNTYGLTAPMDMFLISRFERHPTEIARLQGVRLVVASETTKGRAWDEAKIKNLTGGDKLTGRFMRGDFFDFDPNHKLLITGNHKPSLRNVDEAIRRRLLLVPFTVSIPENERDPELADKLKAEWPAILRWMVDGCLEWRKRGLVVPTIVRDATDQYFADQDTIEQWIEEWIEIDPRVEFTATRDLYKCWKGWCEERNLPPGTEQALSDSLADRGHVRYRKTKARGFKGLAIKVATAPELL